MSIKQIKKALYFIIYYFLYTNLLFSSDYVKVEIENNEEIVVTELSRTLTIVPTTNGFGRSCDGFMGLKSEIDTRLFLLSLEQPLAVYEMGPGAGFMLDHLLTQQTAGHYGAMGITYTYSDLSEESRDPVQRVFTCSSSHASNSCKATLEHDALIALKDEIFADSCDLFLKINTLHFLPPSKFLESLRLANSTLKKGGILAITLNYASSIKDPAFRDVFRQRSTEGNFWPGYATTKRETLRHFRTARFFKGDWKSAVRDSETFQVLGLLPLGTNIQGDVLSLMESHAKQLQDGEVILNIHDQNSIKRLLEFCGFEVQVCNIYNEIYKGKFENSYMGIIASKRYPANFIDLRPYNEGAKKEKIVEALIKEESDTPAVPTDLIHLEIRNALQLIMVHPINGAYTHAEIEDMLQRGISFYRTSTLKK